MASFFRRRISRKVLSLLKQKQELKIPTSLNAVSPFVKIDRFKSVQPKLILPWRRIEELYEQNLSISANDVVRLLRNQGLPTAEGFIDIELSQSPLNIVFTLDKHIFSKIVLLDICDNEEDLAKTSCLFEGLEKKNIVVHCSVPRLGEPFNLTHFRSVIHGNYVANINRFVGHNVVKVAHVNDWGLDTAAFLTGYKQFKTKKLPHKKGTFFLHEVMKAALSEYNNNDKFKEDVHNCYENMERGDANVISEWQSLKQLCCNYYDPIYKRIGVSFDDVHFDSSYHEKSKTIPSELLDNNIISKKDGHIGVNYCDELENNNYANNIKNINSALYDLSRHISAVIEMKRKYNFDSMCYVAPSSLRDFHSTVSYMINKLNYASSEELHQVSLNLITSFDTKRKKIESLDNVLDQIRDNMVLSLHENLQMDLNESLQEMAEQLSLSSLIVNDFKHKRKMNYIFDWLKVTNFKKDTGASFQLCYAGLKGVEEDNEYKITDNTDTSALLESDAHYLIQHLARFDEMVFKSYMLMEPCIIYQYLSSLWYFTDQAANVLKLDIKNDKLRVIKARLLLLSATLKVLNKGLYILGISPLEKVYSPEKSSATYFQ